VRHEWFIEITTTKGHRDLLKMLLDCISRHLIGGVQCCHLDNPAVGGQREMMLSFVLVEAHCRLTMLLQQDHVLFVGHPCWHR